MLLSNDGGIFDAATNDSLAFQLADLIKTDIGTVATAGFDPASIIGIGGLAFVVLLMLAGTVLGGPRKGP